MIWRISGWRTECFVADLGPGEHHVHILAKQKRRRLTWIGGASCGAQSVAYTSENPPVALSVLSRWSNSPLRSGTPDRPLLNWSRNSAVAGSRYIVPSIVYSSK